MALSSEFPVSCPGCGVTHPIPVELAGTEVICHHCKSSFILPDLPERSETPPPAGGGGLVRKILIPVLAGAAVVMGSSIFFSKDPGTVIAARPGVANPAPGPVPAQRSVAVQNAPPRPAPVVPPAREVLPTNEKVAAAAPTPLSSPAPSPDLMPAPLPSSLPVSGVPDPESIPALSSSLTEQQPEPGAIPGASPALAKRDFTDIRKDSRTALERFLRASTLEERLAVSQNPEKIRDEMKAYYQANPSGPLELVELTLLTEGEVAETNRKFELYNVSLKDREAPIPVAVEQTADGYRVDWQTFAESCSHRLRDFFAAPTEERARFRVLLRRAHYFGPPVPGQDSLRIAYTIEPPVRDETFTAWADLDSNVYREKLATGERSSWEAESYVIVELIWRGDERRGRWVGLNRIVSDSWRSE